MKGLIRYTYREVFTALIRQDLLRTPGFIYSHLHLSEGNMVYKKLVDFPDQILLDSSSDSYIAL